MINADWPHLQRFIDDFKSEKDWTADLMANVFIHLLGEMALLNETSFEEIGSLSNLCVYNNLQKVLIALSEQLNETITRLKKSAN